MAIDIMQSHQEYVNSKFIFATNWIPRGKRTLIYHESGGQFADT